MSTDNQPNMPIPGVRYVKQKVYGTEATTLDGETTYREVERTVRVPAPPRDWDLVLVRGLITGALLVTGLSAYWSTDSIGGLLSRSGSEVAAYSVAVIFESTWLSCQAREWLDRRDPERAKIPRRFGYAALAVTMAAIIAHGAVEHEVTSGIVGAVVSALAKAMWINVLGYYAVPMDPGMAHHLLTRRRRIAVKLALGAERRQLAAMEAYERLLYGQTAGDVQVARIETGTAPETTVFPAVPAVSPVSLPHAPAAPAVPAPAPAAPAASPVSPQAAPVPPAPAPTETASAPVSPAPEDTARERVLKGLGLPLDQPGGAPAPAAAEQPPVEPAPTSRPHLQAVNGQTTKTGFIAAAITADPAITLDELTDQVRATFGDKKDLRKDVRRLRSRIEGKAS
ncbi:hypothetical protein ACFC09_15380 [Streptomyces sp. NPDC056161]|uniref:hypothetical protein n=1 Tax=Streptomyces sp. NPDC056161 TaxID=3345732 RepID=UPI0035D6DE6C